MKKLKTLTLNGETYALDTPDVQELTDIREGFDGRDYDTAGDAVRSQVGAIEKRYAKPGNLIDPDRITYGYCDNNGTPKANSGYALSEMIRVTPNTAYNFSYPETENFGVPYLRTVTFFDADKTYISELTTVKSTTAIVTPENAYYLRACFLVSHLESIGCPMLFEGEREVSAYARHAYEFESVAPVSGERLKDRTVKLSALSEDIVAPGKNLFDKSRVSVGFLTKWSEQIAISSNAGDYRTSDFIPVKAGFAYTVSPWARYVSLFNTEKDVLSHINNEGNYDPYTITAEKDGFLRVSVPASSLDTAQVEQGSEATAFEPFAYALAETITLSQKQKESMGAGAGNVLYGKKWVACGDSFTYGSAAGTFAEGKFAGKNKAYPFLIGLRNDMDIVNLAHNGQSLGYPNKGGHAFSDPDPDYGFGYKQIPGDADYITIKLGINDQRDAYHNSTPIGTIDDTDNTTFCGAWNVVLEHILVNHPLAKIGIIVTNGTTVDYANATIAIAEKWGIPYLNEATGADVPTLHRTNKTLPAVVENAKLDAFTNRLVDGDTHPNDAGHAYESTFVEHFLRTL